MKKWFKNNRFILSVFIVWQICLYIVLLISPLVIGSRPGYFGPIKWANFDGIHYLHIATAGYFQYGEAFFPLYPKFISLISGLLPVSPAVIGVTISIFSFLLGLSLFYRLLCRENQTKARWAVIFLLTFPTSFFFGSVYSESLFFLLAVATVFFIEKKYWLAAGICGALASATRIFGIYLPVYAAIIYLRLYKTKIYWRPIIGILLMPLGLLAYMVFLAQRGDPLAFMHVQSAFGANRSSAPVILLPQVLWRYLKIFFTAYMKPTPESYIVSVAEFLVTLAAFWVVWIYRKTVSLAYVILTLCILITPTLTGTLSSMPRYVLSAFPLFIMLSNLYKTRSKYYIVVVFVLLQIISASLFFQGWFIG
jgi:hypothetical protein